MDGCFLIEIRQNIVNGKINYFYVDTNEKVAA